MNGPSELGRLKKQRGACRWLLPALDAQENIHHRITGINQLLKVFICNIRTSEVSKRKAQLLDLLPQQMSAIVGGEIFQVRTWFDGVAGGS